MCVCVCVHGVCVYVFALAFHMFPMANIDLYMCPFFVLLFQYASWDLAFHMIPMANIDLHFAKEQLMLFLREWYMHPNGQVCDVPLKS